MSISGIALYCLRAFSFAAAVCAVYALICRLRGRLISKGRLLGIAYVAALVQITVLRGGVDWPAVLHETRSLPQLVPLGTIMHLLQDGWWSLIYNVVGNLIWFVPLGVLLRRKTWLRALLLGAALSATIELFQYLLMTGATDIDDVILNALGSLTGWAMANMYMYRQKRCR